MATQKATQRLKQPAKVWSAQSETDAAATIRQIGDKSREITRLTAAMNDEIASITQRYTDQIKPVQEQLKELQAGVQTWCEANRDSLTNGGKVKNYSFITGSVMWRQRPPSCTVRGADSVIETLKRLGLTRFVRIKEEINKEAVLNEPATIAGVAGISVVTGVEDFVIEPFEQEVVQ